MEERQNIHQMPDLDESQDRNVFIMMRYRDTDQFRNIENIITRTLYRSGLNAIYARDVLQDPLLWKNITKCMNSCKYGVAVFECLPSVQEESLINANICTELGYMLAQEKKCLILKEKELRLYTDLLGFTYEEFDGHRLNTLKTKVSNWAERQVKVLPLFQGFANLLPNSKIAKRIVIESTAKLHIGKYLAEVYFLKDPRPQSIILDSGTSAAAVAEALFLNRDKYESLDIYTNNLLASLLLCTINEFNCHVVPGKVDDNYAGVFGETACTSISNCKADAAILACTGFTLNNGPYAVDEDNLNFKRAIIENNENIIIVVTSERLSMKPRKEFGEPVIEDPAEWKKTLDKNVTKIVTCPRVNSKRFKDIETKLDGKLKVIDL